tara:strand:+ start:303 stop:1460 length:1158 start_codon:yes stop_codon:yes gene_type:complete
MATSFKTLDPADITSARTMLHEAIPLTGTISSGTYEDDNIKNYAHGMFQSVYDYPYLSSSANHIFDLTTGLSPTSPQSSSTTIQGVQKVQIYNQMAQILAGHDVTGSIREFDQDGELSSGLKFKDCLFLNFSRLLAKDEIQKGTFRMQLNMDPTGTLPLASSTADTVLIQDISGSDSFKTNSPAGEYNILYVTSSNTAQTRRVLDPGLNIPLGVSVPVGLIYYQAGIVLLSSSLFKTQDSGGLLNDITMQTWGGNLAANTGGKFVFISSSYYDINDTLHSASISGTADALRSRIQDIYFTNTTELNSSIYFCRANANEFNYSSNPTYLSSSQVRVKEEAEDEPLTYMTTVGLYSPDNELLAVAKLSEPLKKTPSNEFTLRVRLDY